MFFKKSCNQLIWVVSVYIPLFTGCIDTSQVMIFHTEVQLPGAIGVEHPKGRLRNGRRQVLRVFPRHGSWHGENDAWNCYIMHGWKWCENGGYCYINKKKERFDHGFFDEVEKLRPTFFGIHLCDQMHENMAKDHSFGDSTACCPSWKNPCAKVHCLKFCKETVEALLVKLFFSFSSGLM